MSAHASVDFTDPACLKCIFGACKAVPRQWCIFCSLCKVERGDLVEEFPDKQFTTDYLPIWRESDNEFKQLFADIYDLECKKRQQAHTKFKQSATASQRKAAKTAHHQVDWRTPPAKTAAAIIRAALLSTTIPVLTGPSTSVGTSQNLPSSSQAGIGVKSLSHTSVVSASSHDGELSEGASTYGWDADETSSFSSTNPMYDQMLSSAGPSSGHTVGTSASQGMLPCTYHDMHGPAYHTPSSLSSFVNGYGGKQRSVYPMRDFPWSPNPPDPFRTRPPADLSGSDREDPPYWPPPSTPHANAIMIEATMPSELDPETEAHMWDTYVNFDPDE